MFSPEKSSVKIYNNKLAKIAGLLMLISTLEGCAVATVVGVTVGATMVADRRSFSKQIDDQRIELFAHNELNKQKALSEHSNLQVVSLNGVVLVVGQADNDYIRSLAIKTIQKAPDIALIHNQIRIGPNTSAITKSNDIWLTSKVKSALLANDRVSAEDIKIVTENAEVFLLGIVTENEAEIAVEITRNINGVSRVYKAFEYI